MAVLFVLGLFSGLASAQVDVNEVGLNSGQTVYGVEATGVPSPYTNADSITLWAWGQTDPLAYLDTSFKAYGLFCDANMVSTGAVTVNAIGGDATSTSAADTEVEAYGIYAYDGNDVSNNGLIDVTVTGGTADANDESADASARGYGLYARNSWEWPSTYSAGLEIVSVIAPKKELQSYSLGGVTVTPSDRQVTNTGDVAVTVAGGTATSDEDNAYAQAYGYGVVAHSGDIDNTGAIDVSVTGGQADANDGHAVAAAYAVGIDAISDDVNNTGDVTLYAAGGTADGWGASVNALGVGIWADGVVVNTGDITGTVIAGDATATAAILYYDPAATLYGILADSDASNTGDITLSVDGGTATSSGEDAEADAGAVGIEAMNVYNTGTLDIDVDGGWAYAYGRADAEAYGTGISADGAVNNAGDISVDVLAFYAVPKTNGGQGSAQASAFGIDAGYDVNNTGAISVTATGGFTTDKLRVWRWPSTWYGDDEISWASGTVELAEWPTTKDVWGDSGLFSTAAADVVATGINAVGDVNNTGSLTVAAVGSYLAYASAAEEATATSSATGIYSEGQTNNAGSLLVTANGGTANASDGNADASGVVYGIDSVGSVNNTGAITVVATGGTATANVVTDGNDVWGASYATDAIKGMAVSSAHASGIVSQADVSNTGNITVFAAGGAAEGDNWPRAEAFACGIQADGNVSNTGDIIATATRGTGLGWEPATRSYAYGIYMGGSGTLTNTGTILASGDTAYEVYVANGTTTLVDTYNVALDGDPNVASLGVAEGATLALNDATLKVTRIAGETLWNTQYKLFAADPNAVTGQFGDVQAANPDLVATYYTQDTAGASDDTVSLGYDPTAVETAGSVAVEKQLVWQSRDIVHQRMTSTLLNSVLYPSSSPLLVDAGPIDKTMQLANSAEGKDGRGVFFEPYYSRMDQEADPLGYDARLWGFAAGYVRQMDETLVSVHAGYGQADIDFTGNGYSANSEDQDILTGGFTGLTRLNDWTVRYGATGFYGWHDYKGLTGIDLTETETASIDSYGVIASAMLGRIFQRGSHIILPEVGFNYLWGHRQRYTTDASDPGWDTTYSAMDDHDVEAEANLRWMTGFMHGDIHVTPSAAVGIRHLLTDDESIVYQTIAGTSPASVKSERDRTVVTASGSVALTKANHTLSVAYDGQYSNDTTRHSFWLRYGWQF